MNIHSVWDNQGTSVDRYTVVLDVLHYGEYVYLSLGNDPSSPQGFSQWGTTDYSPREFKIFGKRIDFSDLPQRLQGHVTMRISELSDSIEEEVS